VTRRIQLAIAIGGAAGTLARAGIDEALPHEPGHWPWATFLVNLGGSLVLGWVLGRATAPNRYWRPLLGTGFCGGLTTFSAFGVESFELVRGGHLAAAVGYPLASLAAGLLLAVAGVRIARWSAS
jgi:CrcB protein